MYFACVYVCVSPVSLVTAEVKRPAAPLGLELLTVVSFRVVAGNRALVP